MHYTNRYSQHTLIIFTFHHKGWVFVYNKNGGGCDCCCLHLTELGYLRDIASSMVLVNIEWKFESIIASSSKAESENKKR